TNPNLNQQYAFPANQLGLYAEMSCQVDPTGQWLYFNSPNDLARGLRCIGGPDTSLANAYQVPGGNQITVLNSTGFPLGDQFGVDGPSVNGETGVITAINGTTFTLTGPLNFNHVQGAPVRRIGFPSNTSLEDGQPAPVSPYPGASLLLSNVVSFRVQV